MNKAFRLISSRFCCNRGSRTTLCGRAPGARLGARSRHGDLLSGAGRTRPTGSRFDWRGARPRSRGHRGCPLESAGSARISTFWEWLDDLPDLPGSHAPTLDSAGGFPHRSPSPRSSDRPRVRHERGRRSGHGARGRIGPPSAPGSSDPNGASRRSIRGGWPWRGRRHTRRWVGGPTPARNPALRYRRPPSSFQECVRRGYGGPAALPPVSAFGTLSHAREICGCSGPRPNIAGPAMGCVSGGIRAIYRPTSTFPAPIGAIDGSLA